MQPPPKCPQERIVNSPELPAEQERPEPDHYTASAMQNAQALQKDNTAALKELRYKAPGLKQKEENFDITRAAKRCKTQVCGSEPLSGPSNNDITLPAKRESYFEKLLPAEREYYEKLTQRAKQLQRHFVKLSAKEKQLREELILCIKEVDEEPETQKKKGGTRRNFPC